MYCKMFAQLRRGGREGQHTPMAPPAAWEPVPGAPPAATALTVDKRGYVYWAAAGSIYECVDGVTDRRPRECHAEADEGPGPVLIFKRDVGSVAAMCTTPGGWICACEPDRGEVWLYSRAMLPDQRIATGIAAASCVCNRQGLLFLAEPAASKLWLIDMGPGMDGTPSPRQIVLPIAGQVAPLALGMTYDQQNLVLAGGAASIWTFPLTTAGALSPPTPTAPQYRPEIPHAPAAELRVEAMCVAGSSSSSGAGALLAATSVGLQIFGVAGEMLALEHLPASEIPGAKATGAESGVSEAVALPTLDPAKRSRVAEQQHLRWSVEAPGRVTSVVIGSGAAAPWPHIEAGVKYDMTDCCVYATTTDAGQQLWRRRCSWSATIPSEDVPTASRL